MVVKNRGRGVGPVVCAISLLLAGCSTKPGPAEKVGTAREAALAPACGTGCKSFQAVAATTIYQEVPTASAGAGPSMFAGLTRDDRKDTQAYFKFSITPADIPTNATVTSAVLELHLTSFKTLPGDFNPVVRRVTATWAAGDATTTSARHHPPPRPNVSLNDSTVPALNWNGMLDGGAPVDPSVESAGTAVTDTSVTPNEPWYQFTDGAILDAVRRWVAGEQQNGFRLVNGSNNEQSVHRFDARGVNGPRLKVWFTVPQPLKPNGTNCSAGSECQSTFCVQSRCCSSACTAQECRFTGACGGASINYACEPVAAGARCGGTPAVCADTSRCQGTTCSPQTAKQGTGCDDGNASTQNQCDGLGTGPTHCAVVGTRPVNVYAWGWDQYGQLGDRRSGDGLFQQTPIPVPNFTGATLAGSGAIHTVVVHTNGTVHSWGNNSNGNLGDPAYIQQIRTFADNVPAMSDTTVAVASGSNHSLALTSRGEVYAWGKNFVGQIGVPSIALGTVVRTPTKVPGIANIVAIAAGSHHSMALRADGQMFAWGLNTSGQLGDSTQTNRNGAVPIGSTARYKAIAAGDVFSMALKDDGNVFTWGSNSKGQLGYTTTQPQTQPRFLPPISGAKAIAAGNEFAFAVLGDGTLWGWGNNDHGQVGAERPEVTLPVSQVGLSNVIDIAAGTWFSVAATSSGSVFTWGDNSLGQIGSADRGGQTNFPFPLTAVTNAINVDAGAAHAIVIVESGKIQTWGLNNVGQLGRGTSQTAQPYSESPGYVKLGTNPVPPPFKSVSVGCSHLVALGADGSVWAWGNNSFGQIGVAAGAAVTAPQKVGTISDAIAVSAGCEHSLALRGNGTVLGWGRGDMGQLGRSSTASDSVPQPVTGLARVISISAGAYHNLALNAFGEIYAWGYNTSRQCGTTGGNQLTPIFLSSVTNKFKSISAGYYSSYAISGDRVYAWGADDHGELGDTFRGGVDELPNVVMSAQVELAGATQVRGGLFFAAALAGGDIYGWGDNVAGQWGISAPTSWSSGVRSTSDGLTRVLGAGVAGLERVARHGAGSGAGLAVYGALGNGSTVGGTGFNTTKLDGPAVTIGEGYAFGAAVVR